MIERKLIGIEGNINILEADILDFRRRILMEKLAFIDLRNERVELMKIGGVESKSDDDDDDDDDDAATVPDISQYGEEDEDIHAADIINGDSEEKDQDNGAAEVADNDNQVQEEEAMDVKAGDNGKRDIIVPFGGYRPPMIHALTAATNWEDRIILVEERRNIMSLINGFTRWHGMINKAYSKSDDYINWYAQYELIPEFGQLYVCTHGGVNDGMYDFTDNGDWKAMDFAMSKSTAQTLGYRQAVFELRLSTKKNNWKPAACKVRKVLVKNKEDCYVYDYNLENTDFIDHIQNYYNMPSVDIGIIWIVKYPKYRECHYVLRAQPYPLGKFN